MPKTVLPTPLVPNGSNPSAANSETYANSPRLASRATAVWKNDTPGMQSPTMIDVAVGIEPSHEKISPTDTIAEGWSRHMRMSGAVVPGRYARDGLCFVSCGQCGNRRQVYRHSGVSQWMPFAKNGGAVLSQAVADLEHANPGTEGVLLWVSRIRAAKPSETMRFAKFVKPSPLCFTAKIS